MKRGEDRRDVNRRIRQEAERERLINNGHLSQVIENTKKLQDLDAELDAVAVQRLKAANDVHLKLIGKYLPDLKAMELSQDPENPLISPIDSKMPHSEAARVYKESLKTH